MTKFQKNKIVISTPEQDSLVGDFQDLIYVTDPTIALMFDTEEDAERYATFNPYIQEYCLAYYDGEKVNFTDNLCVKFSP